MPFNLNDWVSPTQDFPGYFRRGVRYKIREIDPISGNYKINSDHGLEWYMAHDIQTNMVLTSPPQNTLIGGYGITSINYDDLFRSIKAHVLEPKKVSCSCGSIKLGHPGHSHYCDLYQKNPYDAVS